MTEENKTLIEVRHLKKYFPIKGGVFSRQVGSVKAVDDVSFTIPEGKVMGLVGESGCGKSTTGRTMLNLIKPTSGELLYRGVDIYKLKPAEMRKYRTKMQIVFQDPYSSLNPRLPVYDIIGEAMLEHHIVANKQEMMSKVFELMDKCGLFPEQAGRYPHQFSGGQRQRICIARALAVNPEFVICDEAVSALDVSIQSQIINLLKDLQDEYKLTYLFISHDLSVVKFISDEVGVMYLGELVEIGSKEQIFDHFCHPYTQALLSAAPSFDPRKRNNDKRIILQGDLPSPANPPSGCRFHTRCPYATERCAKEVPQVYEVEPGHKVRCHFAMDYAKKGF
ncbi:MAG: dipeptide ABC transporter ATP-binding protein [Erysipelotrichaceae bacterium]|jgi:oligopeptide/dipeptide ABC transporter ATP-binding protein|uniref:ABC transporter ATP-binding protein n=1 Tax=Lactimicrobium massiliense TaxID=2161814 RepID=UPI000D560E5E|nr:dipeptide ABC transporter ATP-binding protein [Lactimicrobium massiliense]MCH4020823.1 dipeptide ABC transporter ATP-binding protein [Erysipelotrichaceae bacterium]MCI1326922.1 dipeptide ABC transporter ATP-binding protein [Solobacterium sp.]MCH4044180.1 dipeptide ABC transporter ATP-binding protein [Erysipelotrichaceae bacterium]MCH4121394.1 dipeptide ABC transporter ATP-binding protein [Erysipelotrichaceae bacterium]MCI1363887.1 dipeptide ABC transporter ATP-binding protein [Solobacterium